MQSITRIKNCVVYENKNKGRKLIYGELSTEVINLLESYLTLMKIQNNFNILLNRFYWKITKLKEEQEKSTQEFLDMINNLDQKLDKLSIYRR